MDEVHGNHKLPSSRSRAEQLSRKDPSVKAIRYHVSQPDPINYQTGYFVGFLVG